MMTTPLTISTTQMTGTEMMSDELSEPSSPDSASFDTEDLLGRPLSDDVTTQLAAAGPVGVAAAAAVLSCKKRKHPHYFETNPSKRKRQQTRLLRKLRHTIEEYTTRVGQQAVVLCCTPGKCMSSQVYKVFGSQPLEAVLRNNKTEILQQLDQALQEQTPPSQQENPNLHELPPLVIDGIPTPVNKMTQAQLRNFIPEMLKYSTGRSKPGWGKVECRPVWWPSDLPWANVRSDARTDEEKKRVSWTEALRTIVKNCYKHHGREDLLQVFNEDSQTPAPSAVQATAYSGTMVQTITNPDGTVSIIQIDPGPNSVVTLPDGTQATVVHAIQDVPQQEANQAVHTLAQVATNPDITVQGTQMMATNQDMGVVATPNQPTMAQIATINQGGQQYVLAGGDSSMLGGVVTMVPLSMYQMANNVGTFTVNQAMPQGNIQVAMAPNLTAEPVTVPKEELNQESVEMDQSEDLQINVTTDSGNQDNSNQGESVGNHSDVPDATQNVEITVTSCS